MSEIPSAKRSPRIANGVLYFFGGDTFSLVLELELSDQDGLAISISPSAEVKVVFKNSVGSTIKTFTFSDIADNTVTLEFDSECSALFGKGEYSYDVVYSAGKRTTIAYSNSVIVE